MTLMIFGFWLALNGRVAADTLLFGALITLTILSFGHITGLWTIRREITVYRLLPRGVAYFFALLWQIFLANMQVIGLIFSRRTSPCIRHYMTPLKTKAARAVLANSITLTPGTVTVQLTDNVLTVHCLTGKMADGLGDMPLERQLLKMEEKANG